MGREKVGEGFILGAPPSRVPARHAALKPSRLEMNATPTFWAMYVLCRRLNAIIDQVTRQLRQALCTA